MPQSNFSARLVFDYRHWLFYCKTKKYSLIPFVKEKSFYEKKEIQTFKWSGQQDES